MRKHAYPHQRKILIYMTTFIAVWVCLFLYPPQRENTWNPLVINLFISLLFTLLIVLVTHLIGIKISLPNTLYVALFLAVFCPESEAFFIRDESSLAALGSECAVPFFISQYNRVSHKNFRWWYFLMLLMGFFSSLTHNSITIPLCLTFILLSFYRKQFFHRACWPMVIGFCIGTGVSLWQALKHLPEATDPTSETINTALILHMLWRTKVFVLALALTAYLSVLRQGRRAIRYFARRNTVLTLCLLLSLFTLPMAPLGLENSISGLCFFSMLWLLSISQFVIKTNLKNTYKHYAIRKN